MTTTTTTMTNREFLNTVSAVFNTVVENEEVQRVFGITAEQAAEVINHASRELEKVEKRRNTPTKEQKANAELAEKIITEFVTDQPKSSVELAEAAGITVNKLNGIFRAYVTRGDLIKGKAKFDKRELTTYVLPSLESALDSEEILEAPYDNVGAEE